MTMCFDCNKALNMQNESTFCPVQRLQSEILTGTGEEWGGVFTEFIQSLSVLLEIT